MVNNRQNKFLPIILLSPHIDLAFSCRRFHAHNLFGEPFYSFRVFEFGVQLLALRE
jgi:hypothetical protein